MAYALGTATIGAGGACGVGTSIPTTRCLLATVNCPNGPRGDAVAQLTANLKVSDPSGAVTGTIVCFSGGTSTEFFETLSSGTAAAAVLTPLLALGYRVVQVGWASSPFAGSAGALGVMCRPATLLRAIYDDSSIHTVGLPFVVLGQSGGASQIAYALAHYDAGSWITTAIICSGPPHARMDLSTLGMIDPRAEAALQGRRTASFTTTTYGGADAQLIDSSYGAQTACQNRRFFGGVGNYAFVDSICNGIASYYYPNTRVFFLYGDFDSSCAVPNGRIYAARVMAENGLRAVEHVSTGSVDHVGFPGSASGSALILAAATTALTPLATPTTPTAVYISAGGQSNMAGSGSTPALTTTQPYSSQRWDRTGSALIPLVETTLETPASAMANHLNAGGGAPGIVDNWAIGGTLYANLQKGTTPYTNMLAALTSVASLRAGQPTAAVQAWVHGEADDNAGTSAATYAEYMADLQSDFDADARALFNTAQTSLPLFYSQTSAWPHYATYRVRSTTALAQLTAALTYPDKIFMVGPTYHLPVQNAGLDVHYTNEGARRLGEYLGRTIRQVVLERRRWKPLHMASAVAVGPTITIHVEGGDGSPLVVDTTRMVERSDYGLEYTDNSGAPGAIRSVSVQGRVITVTLDRDVGLAATSPRIRAGLTAPAAVAVGSTGVGPGTNIRDSDPTPSLYGEPLYNWLSIQELELSNVVAGGATRPAWGGTQSLRFPTTSAYARNAEWNALDGATQATWSFWLKRDTVPGNTFAVLAKNRASHRQFDFRVGPSSLTVYIATSLSAIVNAATATNTLTWSGGPWHHVVVVFDGTQGTAANRVTVYIDGVAVALTSTPAWPSILTTGANVELSVGSSANRASALGTCNMRDIAMWRAAATAGQVTALYNAGHAIDVATTALGTPVTYYPLNGTLADYGNGPALRHLSGFGGTTFQTSAP